MSGEAGDHPSAKNANASGEVHSPGSTTSDSSPARRHDEQQGANYSKVLAARHAAFSEMFLGRLRAVQEGKITPEHAAAESANEQTDLTFQRDLAEADAVALGKKADTDFLTGLHNREFFQNRLRNMIKEQRKFALLIIDLDFFKKINDQLGHNEGDKKIIQVASVLSAQVRSEDDVARWGGDEFAVLIEGITDPDVLKRTAEQILKELRDMIPSVHIDDQDRQVTASIGGGIFQQGEEPDAFFDSVDKAMYKAKDNGRNQYVLREQS